jgi:hypothetical protein
MVAFSGSPTLSPWKLYAEVCRFLVRDKFRPPYLFEFFDAFFQSVHHLCQSTEFIVKSQFGIGIFYISRIDLGNKK